MAEDPQSKTDETTSAPTTVENTEAEAAESSQGEGDGEGELTSGDLRGVAGGWSGQDPNP